jgi:hypothetical protein
MKTAPRFKGSWILFAIAATIVAFEAAAWFLSSSYGFRVHPLTVAFVAMGAVAVTASIVYHDVDLG